MLGQTIEAKSPLSKGAIVCLLLAVVLGVAGAITGSLHLLMIAVLPTVLGCVYWRSRPTAVVVTLEEQGILLFGTQHTLPYEEIHAIFIGNHLLNDRTTNLTPGPITIVHDHGRFFMPEQMNVSVLELGNFLLNRLPQQAAKEIHASLVDYATEQLSKFGADKVECIRQRASAHQALRISRLAVIGKSLLITSLLWFFISAVVFSNDNTSATFTDWTALAILGLVIGILLWLFGKSRVKNSQIDTRKYGQACLVIGPSGLGLAQGDLQGKLRWDEIAGIKNGPAKSLGSGNDSALHLSIGGGEIVLLDIYDRSLAEIASLISENTRMPAS